jgi:hypothetical protein
MATPEGSPNCDNSSPAPRVFMYIELVTGERTRSLGRARTQRPKLGGYGQDRERMKHHWTLQIDLRTTIGLLFSVLCVVCLCLCPTPVRWPYPSP